MQHILLLRILLWVYLWFGFFFPFKWFLIKVILCLSPLPSLFSPHTILKILSLTSCSTKHLKYFKTHSSKNIQAKSSYLKSLDQPVGQLNSFVCLGHIILILDFLCNCFLKWSCELTQIAIQNLFRKGMGKYYSLRFVGFFWCCFLYFILFHFILYNVF